MRSTHHRDCMAPDTEPTDEELAAVMREAADVARSRKKIGDAWLAEQVASALEAAGLREGAAIARHQLASAQAAR